MKTDRERARDRAWREANREHLRAYAKEYNREHGQRIRAARKEYHRNWARANSDKMRAYGARYRKAHPEQSADKHLRKKYGITMADYRALLLAQDGKCAICRKAEVRTWRWKTTRLSVDHDHATGKVRGLLCDRCNISLPFLEAGLADRAFAYLKGEACFT